MYSRANGIRLLYNSLFRPSTVLTSWLIYMKTAMSIRH